MCIRARLLFLAEQKFRCQAKDLSSAAQGGLAFSKTLQVPTPFAAADVISHDDNSHVEYHYTIVEVTVKFARATNEHRGLSTLHVHAWLRHIEKLCIGCSRA